MASKPGTHVGPYEITAPLGAIERLYFLAKIEKGVREADAGLTVPHDEAKQRLTGA